MIVVTGATGNTGRAAAEALLAGGHAVRVITRSAANGAELEKAGAQVAVGSLTDADFLRGAFADAHAVYAMMPPNMQAPDFRAYQNALGAALASGLAESPATHVVTLSTYGAHIPEGTGVIAGVYDFEQRFGRELAGKHITHLRAGFFLENFFAMIGTIKAFNVFGGFPIRGDVKIPMVHAPEIGALAASLLAQKSFEGHRWLNVAHPESATLSEAVEVLASSINRPDLSWVQFPYDQAEQGMLAGGFSASVAKEYIEFSRAISDRHDEFYAYSELTEEGSTKTGVKEFAPLFAAVYGS